MLHWLVSLKVCCTRVARIHQSKISPVTLLAQQILLSVFTTARGFAATALDHGTSRFEEGRGSIQVFLSHSTCSSHCRNSASLPIGKYVDDESSYAAGSLDAGADEGSGFGDRI